MPHPTRWLLAAAGTATSLAFSPAAMAQEPTQPIITPNVCVERLQTESGARDGGLRAHFWYERYGGEALDIP